MRYRTVQKIQKFQKGAEEYKEKRTMAEKFPEKRALTPATPQKTDIPTSKKLGCFFIGSHRISAETG